MTSRTNPLAVLKPIVVEVTAEYGMTVHLGTDSISIPQRDAALDFLNGKLSSSDVFRLLESKSGQGFAIAGSTSKSARDGIDEVNSLIAPKFARTGTLSLKTVRQGRRKVGVEATLKLGSLYGLGATLPRLDTDPSQALRLDHRGSTVVFSLKKPGRDDEQLIRSAVRVADAFGVYILRVPRHIEDEDSDAKLIPAFDFQD